jgi:hypothetical protein
LSDLKNRHLLKNLLQKSIRQQFTELAPSTPNNRFELFAKTLLKYEIPSWNHEQANFEVKSGVHL